MRLRRRSSSGTTPPRITRHAAACRLEDQALRYGAPTVAGCPEVDILGGLGPALSYLHRRWVTYLGVAVDDQIENTVDAAAVARAWRSVGAAHPGLAAILAHHADHPEVVAADARHRRLVASAARCRAGQLPWFCAEGVEDGDPTTPPRHLLAVGP